MCSGNLVPSPLIWRTGWDNHHAIPCPICFCVCGCPYYSSLLVRLSPSGQAGGLQETRSVAVMTASFNPTFPCATDGRTILTRPVYVRHLHYTARSCIVAGATLGTGFIFREALDAPQMTSACHAGWFTDALNVRTVLCHGPEGHEARTYKKSTRKLRGSGAKQRIATTRWDPAQQAERATAEKCDLTLHSFPWWRHQVGACTQRQARTQEREREGGYAQRRARVRQQVCAQHWWAWPLQRAWALLPRARVGAAGCPSRLAPE